MHCIHYSFINTLLHYCRIDITVDNSIRLMSCAGQIIISLSNKGDASAVKHPNGLVQQTDKFVQLLAHDQSKNNNFTYVMSHGRLKNDLMCVMCLKMYHFL